MRPGVACGAAWRGLWRGVWPSLACGLWLVPWHDLWRGAAWRDLWPGVNWFHLTGFYQINILIRYSSFNLRYLELISVYPEMIFCSRK